MPQIMNQRGHSQGPTTRLESAGGSGLGRSEGRVYQGRLPDPNPVPRVNSSELRSLLFFALSL